MPASYLESITYYFISQLPPKMGSFRFRQFRGVRAGRICTFTFGRRSLSSAQAHRGFPSELRFPWRASVRTAKETSSGDAARAFRRGAGRTRNLAARVFLGVVHPDHGAVYLELREESLDVDAMTASYS